MEGREYGGLSDHVTGRETGACACPLIPFVQTNTHFDCRLDVAEEEVLGPEFMSHGMCDGLEHLKGTLI